MPTITLAQFIDGYKKGHITEIVLIKNTLYGKDSRDTQNNTRAPEIVWVVIP